jgi:hypothetical protein
MKCLLTFHFFFFFVGLRRNLKGIYYLCIFFVIVNEMFLLTFWFFSFCRSMPSENFQNKILKVKLQNYFIFFYLNEMLTNISFHLFFLSLWLLDGILYRISKVKLQILSSRSWRTKTLQKTNKQNVSKHFIKLHWSKNKIFYIYFTPISTWYV